MKELLERNKQSEKERIEALKQSLKELDNSGNDNTQFSLKLPVEETKDLIAVHNLTQEELLKTLKLGGFPMPSVAIVKAVSYTHLDVYKRQLRASSRGNT